MANTYNQIFVQFVISVKNKMPLIKPEWEHRLYQYITTTIDSRKNKTLIINGTKDHIHILVSMDKNESPAKLMLCVKQFSSKFIKQNFCKNFSWQEGYGCFSYTKSHIDPVFKYIENQKEHHKKVSFKDELVALVKEMGVEGDLKYLFVD